VNVIRVLARWTIGAVLAAVLVPAADDPARRQEASAEGRSSLGGRPSNHQQATDHGPSGTVGASLGAEWVRAGINTNRPTWGLHGGLLWGLPPARGPSPDGPRGLIRLRYPVLPTGDYDLINFIAIEPVVSGQKGFSELERSQLDGVPGKRLWAVDGGAPGETFTNLVVGRLARLESGAERLTVRLRVERFENGAHVVLTLSQRSDVPDELELTLHAEPDSAPIEYCILTATMGNKARARRLWLKDETVSSLELYGDYTEFGFTAHRIFPLDRLQRTPAGEILAAITTDEPDPGSVDPAPAAAHWRYRGFPVTQYWTKPPGTSQNDPQVAVNGRFGTLIGSPGNRLWERTGTRLLPRVGLLPIDKAVASTTSLSGLRLTRRAASTIKSTGSEPGAPGLPSTKCWNSRRSRSHLHRFRNR